MSWLERLGVQRRPFRALVRSYLLMDLRAQTYAQATNSKPGEAIPPFYWVLVQFLSVSLLLAAILQSRVPAEVYAALHLATTAVLTFGAMLVEFHEAIVNPEDVRVVAHRPVRDRTWAAARLCNLGAYVGLVLVSATIFPAIMGSALRDASPLWLACYPLAAAATAACAAGVALLVLLAFAGERLDGVRRLASWLQIVAILVLFYGGQLMLRNATGDVELWALDPPQWFRLLPTTWLGQQVAHGQLTNVVAVAVVVLVAGALALAPLTRRWRGFATVATAPRRVEHEGPPLRVTLRTSWLSRLGASQREQAILGLAARVHARDGDLRIRVFSTLALPVAAAVLGLLTDQYEPPGRGAIGSQVLPVLAAVSLAASLVQGLAPWLTSSDHRAAWQLRAVWGPAARRGVVSLMLVRVHAPLWLLHLAVLLGVWREPWIVLQYGLAGWGLILCTAHLAARTLLHEPILRLPPRAGSGVGTQPLVVVGAGAFAATLGGVWCALAPWPALGWAFAGLLLVLARWLRSRP